MTLGARATTDCGTLACFSYLSSQHWVEIKTHAHPNVPDMSYASVMILNFKAGKREINVSILQIVKMLDSNNMQV